MLCLLLPSPPATASITAITSAIDPKHNRSNLQCSCFDLLDPLSVLGEDSPLLLLLACLPACLPTSENKRNTGGTSDNGREHPCVWYCFSRNRSIPLPTSRCKCAPPRYTSSSSSSAVIVAPVVAMLACCSLSVTRSPPRESKLLANAEQKERTKDVEKRRLGALLKAREKKGRGRAGVEASCVVCPPPCLPLYGL